MKIMFGKKKEPKKIVFKKLVMLKDGLPNFLNDIVIEIAVDEPNECITFSEWKKKDNNTASLSFEKISSLEIGEKGSTLADSSTAGAVIGGMIGGLPGAVIGSTTGKKAPNIPTLRIKYLSNDGEKEINLYQCNHYSDNSIQFIKTMIDKNIKKQLQKESHINL